MFNFFNRYGIRLEYCWNISQILHGLIKRKVLTNEKTQHPLPLPIGIPSYVGFNCEIECSAKF